MREILFLAHRPPWPPDRGDKIRSWHLLDRLARIAPVHLACLADSDAERDRALDSAPRDLLASCGIFTRSGLKPTRALTAVLRGEPALLALFDSPDLREHVDETLGSHPIGCILAFSAQMAQFVPDAIGESRFVMDFVDVDSAKFESYAQTGNPLMRLVYAREARRLAAYERAIAERADASLFVSDAEAALFRKRTGAGRVSALHNGVDLARFDPAGSYAVPGKTGPMIVFTGQMDYRPNIEAVTRFANDTLPLIRAKRPDTGFAIVGRNPDPTVTALAALPGVTVTGEVPDIRGWLAAAEVVVAPLGIARGVQNKVLEAMAMARPVVASPAAFEGIEAVDGDELLVADGDAAQAGAVLALLADPARAGDIGRAARRRIEASYGWEARLAGLPAIVGLDRPALLDAAE